MGKIGIRSVGQKPAQKRIRLPEKGSTSKWVVENWGQIPEGVGSGRNGGDDARKTGGGEKKIET